MGIGISWMIGWIVISFIYIGVVGERFSEVIPWRMLLLEEVRGKRKRYILKKNKLK